MNKLYMYFTYEADMGNTETLDLALLLRVYNNICIHLFYIQSI